jgi:DNA-binding protein H-NS
MLAETALHHPLFQPKRTFEARVTLPADVDDPGRHRRWSLRGRRPADGPSGTRHNVTTLGPAWQLTALRTLYGA